MSGTSDDLRLTEEMEPEEAVRRMIADGLDAHNVAAAGPGGSTPLWVIARDADGGVQGGLRGLTFWSWLHIEWLWVAEPFRRRGVGSRLLRRAEAIARDRGCIAAYLDTFSFQAPDFYPRHGYREFGRLEGLPPGHARIWLSKRFDDPAP